MECYTWRKEKLDIDSHYNHYPRKDTLFNESLKVFQKCNKACAICTSIDLSLYSPHCQAKKCKTDYSYVQNNEDICFPHDPGFPFHYLYTDDNSGEKYFRPLIQGKNILDPVMILVKLVQHQEQEVLIIASLVEKDIYFILMT